MERLQAYKFFYFFLSPMSLRMAFGELLHSQAEAAQPWVAMG